MLGPHPRQVPPPSVQLHPGESPAGAPRTWSALTPRPAASELAQPHSRAQGPASNQELGAPLGAILGAPRTMHPRRPWSRPRHRSQADPREGSGAPRSPPPRLRGCPLGVARLSQSRLCQLKSTPQGAQVLTAGTGAGEGSPHTVVRTCGVLGGPLASRGGPPVDGTPGAAGQHCCRKGSRQRSRHTAKH